MRNLSNLLSALILTVALFSVLVQCTLRSEKSVKKSLGSCTSKQFRCDDGECIKLKNLCDGDSDCDDGSDEAGRTCAPPTTTTSPAVVCAKNQFQCGDGSCIKLKFRCDGDPDCPDGSDESPETCAPPTTTTTARICAANQYQCGDGSCIKLKLRCDNDPDCPDGSDEFPEVCGPAVSTDDSIQACSESQAQCPDGTCIEGSQVCDGSADCPDGSDEDTQICTATSPSEVCREDQAQCPEGTCIDQSQVCDGSVDCANGEDEAPDECTTVSTAACTEDEYQCGDGSACISSGFLCDGQNDCRDGSDEVDEHCQGVDRSMTELDSALPQAPEIPLPPPRSYEDEKIIDDIMDLLSKGDDHITLSPQYTDLVLVVGNTGAGKTTITKFLTTDNSKLVSYKSGHRFLIKDTDGHISTDSTIVSKTIFPQLLIDSETSTAFYDLPGFSDTRSPAIEIANAYFMKKVANHAVRVKIIFVVNHSSLKPSESRTDVKTLLDHATDFIKKPNKFSSGIALVASKVEVAEKDPVLYQHMAEFLEQAQYDLPAIFQEEGKQEVCADLLDIFLTKKQKQYSRLAAFRQPRTTGRLDTLSGVQSARNHMRKVIFQNIHFVPCEPEDFGISISTSAKLFAINLEDKLNQKLISIMVEFGNQLLQYFSDLFKNNADPYNFLPEVHSFHATFKDRVKFLKAAGSEEEFLQRLAIFNGTFPSEQLQVILDGLTASSERLTVLHQLTSASPLKFKKSILINPMEKVEEYLELNVYTVATTVNHRLVSLTEALILEIQEGYDNLVTNLGQLSLQELFEDDNKVFIQILLGDDKTLGALVQGQDKINSVREFFNSTLDAIGSLGYAQVAPPENFAPFEKIPLDSYDIDFGSKPSPINLSKCKLLVQVLSEFLTGRVSLLKDHVETLKEQQELGKLEQFLNATHLEIVSNATKAENNLKRLEKILSDVQENYAKDIEAEKALAAETAAVFG